GWEGYTGGPFFEATARPEIMLLLAPAKPQPFFEMPEAYVGTTREQSDLQIAAGRKLEHWNRLDDDWRLGIWQPRYRWDYLDPETVGLTGAFFHFEQRF